MDMYKLKWTRLQSEIFRLLCIKCGHSLNLRSIARSLKVSPTAVSKSLIELEKEDLIKIKKSNSINLLSIDLNSENHKAVELKRVENLKLIYESGLSNFLFEKFPGNTIILFGSYSRGEDVWTNEPEGHISDIDIAIIGTKEKNIDLIKFDKFSALLERTVSINFYHNWKEIHKNLKDNILNGIVLTGGVDL